MDGGCPGVSSRDGRWGGCVANRYAHTKLAATAAAAAADAAAADSVLGGSDAQTSHTICMATGPWLPRQTIYTCADNRREPMSTWQVHRLAPSNGKLNPPPRDGSHLAYY